MGTYRTEPDWNEAPQGATHWGNENYNTNEWWYKADGNFYYYCGGEYDTWEMLHSTETPLGAEGQGHDYILEVPQDIPVKQFSKQERYKDIVGNDLIDEFGEEESVEAFRGAMKFTLKRYMRRLGKKDSLVSELTKMADYCLRWAEYEKKLGDNGLEDEE